MTTSASIGLINLRQLVLLEKKKIAHITINAKKHHAMKKQDRISQAIFSAPKRVLVEQLIRDNLLISLKEHIKDKRTFSKKEIENLRSNLSSLNGYEWSIQPSGKGCYLTFQFKQLRPGLNFILNTDSSFELKTFNYDIRLKQ
ncbi:hypothetical protein [Vibrio rotiferianus]|uniref:hypothetical protein n=1 Tax=Vibrio rotiferianus TaxID=190895 RepID=UPI0005F04E2D|nr:hypothetical protein [Vibrio rotiferianus]